MGGGENFCPCKSCKGVIQKAYSTMRDHKKRYGYVLSLSMWGLLFLLTVSLFCFFLASAVGETEQQSVAAEFEDAKGKDVSEPNDAATKPSSKSVSSRSKDNSKDKKSKKSTSAKGTGRRTQKTPAADPARKTGTPVKRKSNTQNGKSRSPVKIKKTAADSNRPKECQPCLR